MLHDLWASRRAGVLSWCLPGPARSPGNDLQLVRLGTLPSRTSHRADLQAGCWPSLGLGAAAAMAPPINFLWHLVHNKQKAKQMENLSPEIFLSVRTLARYSLYIKTFEWLATNSHKPAQSKNSSPPLLTSTDVSFLHTGTRVSLGSKPCSVLLRGNEIAIYLWKRKKIHFKVRRKHLPTQSLPSLQSYQARSPVLARAGSPALAAGGCTAAPGFLVLCGWKVRCCSYSLTPQPGWLSTRLESTQPAEELLWVLQQLTISAQLSSI